MKQVAFERNTSKFSTKKSLRPAQKLGVDFDIQREKILEVHTKLLGKPTGHRARMFAIDMWQLYNEMEGEKE
ncbi:MAG: hypothetical protein IKB21_03025 [Clostridia bacterium]|nr:hypothetical protein [Clostridia bacterium]MBR2220691.1 hypothetical protein [Clostridia bacterium]MBR2433558.1 hypothetical protein [Clostridia bacterium]